MPGEKVHFLYLWSKSGLFSRENIFKQKRVSRCSFVLQYYSAEEYFTRIVGLPKVFWMLQIYCYLVMILQIFFSYDAILL